MFIYIYGNERAQSTNTRKSPRMHSLALTQIISSRRSGYLFVSDELTKRAQCSRRRRAPRGYLSR